MGSPKAFLPYAAEETFLDRVLAVYAAAGCDAVVVLRDRAGAFPVISRRRAARPRAVLVAYNRDPESDRIGSIRRGLAIAPRRAPIFVQDVDRPFVGLEVLDALLSSLPNDGYAAPDIDGHGGHPLLLSAAAAERLRADRSSSTLRDALEGFARVLVPIVDRACDLNINTPDDYRLHFASEARNVP